MEGFASYFLKESKINLENISYETEVLTPPLPPSMKLSCKDTILAQLADRGVKINFNRALSFGEKGPFSLSVTFSVFMPFDPSKKDLVQWKEIDIAGEFKKGCPRQLTALMSRTSLLISQITASSGQPPIITPGAVSVLSDGNL